MRFTATRRIREAVGEFWGDVLKAIAGIAAASVIGFLLWLTSPVKGWLAAPQTLSGWALAATCAAVALVTFTLTFVWLGRRIATLQRSVAEVRDLATRDSLTGLYSQSQIIPVLQERIAETQAECLCFSVIMIDIDAFKSINDSFSHVVGNRVLEQVARELPGRSSGDSTFRFGGDEFLIISKVTQRRSEGYGFAERIRREIASAHFLAEENSHRRVSLTVSCGVTVFTPGDTPQSILDRVSLALHEAKRPRVDADGIERSKNFVFVQNAEETFPILPSARAKQ
jgi:diguanylate cyclase (GGDEF)-like protein